MLLEKLIRFVEEGWTDAHRASNLLIYAKIIGAWQQDQCLIIEAALQRKSSFERDFAELSADRVRVIFFASEKFEI